MKITIEFDEPDLIKEICNKNYKKIPKKYIAYSALDESMPKKSALHDCLNEYDKEPFRELLDSKYGVIYATTITFKSKWTGGFNIHDLHKVFIEDMYKYTRKKNMKYYLVPEVANNLHYHGIIAYKKSISYEDHKVEFDVFKNWLNRKYGPVNMFNRVYDLYAEYEEEIKTKYKKRKRMTSFDSIYKYIHKDVWRKELGIPKTILM